MKTITKAVLGGAMLAGAAVAAHAQIVPIPQPSTGSSELLFVVQDVTNSTSYTLVLAPTVGSGSGSYFTSSEATSSGAVAGSTVGTVYGDGGFSLSLSSNTNLQTFISNAETAGQTLQWGIEGAAYTGSTVGAREGLGSTLIVSTDQSAPLAVNASTIAGTIGPDINTDVKNTNSAGFDAFMGTSAGPIGSSDDVNFNLYGQTSVAQGQAIGTSALSLYGLTTTGSSSGQGLVSLLGSATFNGTTLTFTGETAAVPIPAAAWLLGSGLLGLLGVARRNRRGTAAAA
jgi:hypothetical protein